MKKNDGKKRFMKKFIIKFQRQKVTDGQHKECGGYEDDSDLFTIKNGYEIADNNELGNTQTRPY